MIMPSVTEVSTPLQEFPGSIYSFETIQPHTESDGSRIVEDQDTREKSHWNSGRWWPWRWRADSPTCRTSIINDAKATVTKNDSSLCAAFFKISCCCNSFARTARWTYLKYNLRFRNTFDAFWNSFHNSKIQIALSEIHFTFEWSFRNSIQLSEIHFSFSEIKLTFSEIQVKKSVEQVGLPLTHGFLGEIYSIANSSNRLML